MAVSASPGMPNANNGINAAAEKAQHPIQSGCAGTMMGFYFLRDADAVITDYASAKEHADTEKYGRYFHAMMEQGVYFAPSQFEAGFVSSVHGDAEIGQTLRAIETVFAEL